jgi:hypothetical protein
MKFTCSIIIQQPRTRVVELFSNPKYLKHYQKNFIEKKLVSGTEGTSHAKSKLYYKMGKGIMVLTETIVNNNLPESFHGHYHHKDMDNTMDSYFDVVDSNTTKYTVDIHYIAFRGVLANTMRLLFPFILKKQVKKWMANFKTFSESRSTKNNY